MPPTRRTMSNPSQMANRRPAVSSRNSDGLKCNFCPKVCRNRYDLEIHQRIHTGEKPFRCTAPNCRKSFKSNSQLTRHYLDMHAEKKFKCRACGKLFGREYALKLHRCHSAGLSQSNDEEFDGLANAAYSLRPRSKTQNYKTQNNETFMDDVEVVFDDSQDSDYEPSELETEATKDESVLKGEAQNGNQNERFSCDQKPNLVTHQASHHSATQRKASGSRHPARSNEEERRGSRPPESPESVGQRQSSEGASSGPAARDVLNGEEQNGRSDQDVPAAASRDRVPADTPVNVLSSNEQERVKISFGVQHLDEYLQAEFKHTNRFLEDKLSRMVKFLGEYRRLNGAN